MGSAVDIEIDKIVLDKGNPRIKHFLEMYTELNEEQMVIALGAGSEHEGSTAPQGSYERLKKSIEASGGIIQPIILKSSGNDLYLCIEGNTRVVIYRELREQERAAGRSEEKWNAIPAIVNDEMQDVEAHKIRLQVHLVGNRPWDAYSKAKYLNELLELHHMPLSDLVNFCGGSKRDVLESLDAYRDMETHYRPQLNDDGDFDPTRFSSFVELQKPGIKDALYDAGYNEQAFAQWVDTGKIAPQNMVRKLPRILKNNEAKGAFLRDGAREAMKILDSPDLDTKLREASISQLARVLQEKIDRLSFDESIALAENQETDTYQDLKALQSCLEECIGN